jgi:uncharacterized protein YdhG (YjbR/CyaY superfamily)
MHRLMSEKKHSEGAAEKSGSVFSREERAAMKEAIRERRPRPRAAKGQEEQEVLEKIAGMQSPDRQMAERLHALIKSTAPSLTSRTWYGMPAYSKDGEILCYFRPAEKFKTRYATIGFSDEAKLDDGHMWPTDFALTQLTAADEARIVALVKKAVG